MNASPPAASTAAHARQAPQGLRRHLGALLDTYRPGIALPGPFFTDDALYAAEMEYLFGRHWLFLASEPEIPEGGDYRTYQIGPYPIFILRQDDGAIAAFHNTCRHRGARVLQQPSGVVGAKLVCPYHRWSYDTNGRVIGCGASRDHATTRSDSRSTQRRLRFHLRRIREH